MSNKLVKNINFSSLNCKNLKGNLVYSQYIADISDLSYYSETWTYPNDLPLIKKMASNSNNFFYHKSDMKVRAKGRPFGGQLWLINRNFKIIECNFLCRHSSYVNFSINNIEFLCIGLYLPFDDPKNKDNSKSIFQLTLSKILALIERHKDKNIPIILMGDFNADIHRNNRFDDILKKFINDNEMIVLDHITEKKIPHTYTTAKVLNKRLNRTKSFQYNLDHFILYSKHSLAILKNSTFIVLDDVANTSDHRAINYFFQLETSHDNPNIQTEKTTSGNPNFENSVILKFYQLKVEEKLNVIKNKILEDNAQDQKFIDELYSSLCDIFVESSEDTVLFQNSFIKPKDPDKSKKKKPSLNDEQKEILKKMNEIYKNSLKGVEHPDPLKEQEHENLKRALRRTQRYNLFLEEQKELNDLDRIAKEKNRNKFWRFVKKNRKKRLDNREISIDSTSLFNHYKNFFYENDFAPNVEQKLISEKVNETFNNFSNNKIIKKFKASDLEKTLKELKNSHVKGFDKISYSMIKNALSPDVEEFFLFFFNKIMELMKIPKNLNVSIIKPILKDQEKSTDDINNIRPISISNCFAQIFEKLILIKSPKLSITHKNQFGFKRKTSCNHAVFTLKETILHYTENRSGVKVASLDAEKAFDKTWRDGLFYKLIPEMDITFWYVLKIYYDSSKGTILLAVNCFSELFIINVGVKQGGKLSSYLFGKLIDALIKKCIEEKVGALIHNINVCIIVYADDILLISPNDHQLQKLLNICGEYGEIWKIKFNSLKSNIIEFGEQFFANSDFYLNKRLIPKVEKLKYLGVFIDKNCDFDLLANEKFLNVQKSIFSLSFLGLKPSGISPFLQSFIYKTYCLSQFTYALETTTLLKGTRDYLNVSQNNLIRQIIGLPKTCHMTRLLRLLKIFNFEELYISTKIAFLDSIKNNCISSAIFDYLCINKSKSKRYSKSFVQDIKVLEGHFDYDISAIFENPSYFKKLIKKQSTVPDGISDSINICLNNYKSKKYKKMLEDLTKPQFIREDEEFQELLQYLIITGYS